MEYIIEIGISVILGTIALTFFISFIIFRWLMKYLSKVEKLESKTNELPCDKNYEILMKHAEAASATLARLEKMESKTSELPCDKNYEMLMKHAEASSATLARLEQMESKTSELPCDKNSETLIKHAETLASHKETNSALRAAIERNNELTDKLILHLVENTLSHSQSPLSLSPLGEETAQKMKIHEIIQNNWTSINAYIEGKAESKNAYDLQQLCLETAALSLEKIINKTDLDKIKAFAFDEGQTLFFYAVMIGIIIRDLYFKEHNIS